MTTKYLDKDGLTFLWGKLKNYFQPKLVSGTNIKTVNNTSLLGSGNISITGNVTGVKGNSESSYRTGNVNITADNVGAIPKNTNGNTQQLYRPLSLNGLNDNTLQTLVNTTRANRLAFLPADQIIIEKTTDGGTTWVDAGFSDTAKVALFSETRQSIAVPLLNGVRDVRCGLRITITGMKYNVPSGTAETEKYNYWNASYVNKTERYCQLKELYFWVTTANAGCSVRVDRATGASPNNWVNAYDSGSTFALTGWSGCDYIRFSQGVFGGGTTQTGNYWNYRLTFFQRNSTGGTDLPTTYTTSPATLMEIRGYGDTWWTRGNEYMANDKLFRHDYLQNAFFPSSIIPEENNTKNLGTSANKWNGAYISTVYGNLQGNVTGTASGNLPLAGGTMSNNSQITMPQTNYIDTGVRINLSNDKYLFFGAGSGMTNRGIYDSAFNDWILVSNGSSVTLKGNAATATNATKVNNHTVDKDVPSNAVFTDTKVTALANHYTPSGGTTTSASGATGTSGTTVQVVTGITKDAAGHVTGITSGAATDTTYESKSAASGGTAVSLVTTGEKYTWNNKSSLGLGETSSTAYRGDRGKTAYDHSQSTHARTDATKTEASSTNGNIKINGTETTVYTHPSGTNPHGTTKSDVGLGNVGNFKAVSTVASQGLTSTEQSNARANIGAGTSSLTLGTTSTTAAKGDHTHSAYENVVTGVTDNQTKLRVDYKSQGTSLYAEVPTVSGMDAKQDTLVSGTNIKTINNNSILGSGNISISGSGVTPSFSGLDNNAGSVVLGDLVIEWGTVSITSGSSGGTAGGVTLYAGQTNVTYTNTFAYHPSVSLAWSGNYVNQVALATLNTSNTGFTVVGRLLTANSARNVRWLAIGKKA